jgi:hypothetical protein
MDRAAPSQVVLCQTVRRKCSQKTENSIIQRYGFSHYAVKMVDQVKVALEIGSGKVVVPLWK